MFCQLEARVPEFDAVCSVHCTLYSVQCTVYTVHSTARERRDCVSNSKTLVSNRQNTANPKYKDDSSLLISEYLISAVLECRRPDNCEECRSENRN